MNKWIFPEVVELNVTETKHGDLPAFPLDGDYTDNGLPYGADAGNNS